MTSSQMAQIQVVPSTDGSQLEGTAAANKAPAETVPREINPNAAENGEGNENGSEEEKQERDGKEDDKVFEGIDQDDFCLVSKQIVSSSW